MFYLIINNQNGLITSTLRIAHVEMHSI